MMFGFNTFLEFFYKMWWIYFWFGTTYGVLAREGAQEGERRSSPVINPPLSREG